MTNQGWQMAVEHFCFVHSHRWLGHYWPLVSALRSTRTSVRHASGSSLSLSSSLRPSTRRAKAPFRTRIQQKCLPWLSASKVWHFLLQLAWAGPPYYPSHFLGCSSNSQPLVVCSFLSFYTGLLSITAHTAFAFYAGLNVIAFVMIFLFVPLVFLYPWCSIAKVASQ